MVNLCVCVCVFANFLSIHINNVLMKIVLILMSGILVWCGTFGGWSSDDDATYTFFFLILLRCLSLNFITFLRCFFFLLLITTQIKFLIYLPKTMAFFSSFVYILTLLRKMKFNIKAYERKKKRKIFLIYLHLLRHQSLCLDMV